MSAAPTATQQDLQRAQVLAELERLGGQTVKQDEVTFEGQRIVLPTGTTLAENAEFLARLAADQEAYTEWHRKYNYKPWDVAYNLSRALKRIFGAMRHTGTWLQPPSFMEIPSGPNEVVQVPQGVFSIPHLPDVEFSVGSTRDPEWGLVGVLNAEGPKREAARVNGVFEVIEQELRNASLYKGKAIEYGDMPAFIDVARIDPSKIVYSDEVQAAIDTHINARLRHPEALSALGIGFRSKILLDGEFGVGKTELLNLVAKEAQGREVTFILVPKDRNADLLDAMRMAKMYSPAIVAFEDVDTIASAEQEMEHVSAVLDAFDGSQAKLSDVMVLITTNYVESLHAGMMRPGRIDALIHITPPDAKGIRKLIEVRTPAHVLAEDVKWDKVAAAMEGYNPAFVVEAASRAMRYAVVRSAEANSNTTVVDTADLVAAAVELRRQWDLHRAAKTHSETPRFLDGQVQQIVTETVHTVLEERLDPRLIRDREQ